MPVPPPRAKRNFRSTCFSQDRRSVGIIISVVPYPPFPSSMFQLIHYSSKFNHADKKSFQSSQISAAGKSVFNFPLPRIQCCSKKKRALSEGLPRYTTQTLPFALTPLRPIRLTICVSHFNIEFDGGGEFGGSSISHGGDDILVSFMQRLRKDFGSSTVLAPMKCAGSSCSRRKPQVRSRTGRKDEGR